MSEKKQTIWQTENNNWVIWYYLHNFKNAKNTHGGVLLLVKLHAEASHIKNREHLKKFAIDTQCANHSP